MTTKPADLPPLDPRIDSIADWLADLRESLRSGTDVDVPCGSCTACCTSSLFIHVASDEVDTLRQIPPELLFPAPGRADGTLVMGYDEQGHCPMFDGQGCSIYEHRPRTCRTFDCRLLGALEIDAGGPAHELITLRSSQWRLHEPARTESSAALPSSIVALRRALGFLHDHPECLPRGVSRSPSALATYALETHHLFSERRLDEEEADGQISAVRACLAELPQGRNP